MLATARRPRHVNKSQGECGENARIPSKIKMITSFLDKYFSPSNPCNSMFIMKPAPFLFGLILFATLIVDHHFFLLNIIHIILFLSLNSYFQCIHSLHHNDFLFIFISLLYFFKCKKSRALHDGLFGSHRAHYLLNCVCMTSFVDHNTSSHFARQGIEDQIHELSEVVLSYRPVSARLYDYVFGA